jgi:hypothetical protein
MEMIIEDIKCLPGVSCVFCFDTRTGIVAKRASPKFSEEDLSSVGRTLAKVFSGGKQLFADLQSVQLSVDQWSIFIIWVAGTHYLTIIHEQSLNPNLLSMTLAQAVKDLTAALSTPAAGAAIPPTAKAGNVPEKVRQALMSGPYPRVLAAMEASLAKVMGPMASIVFKDTLEKWTDGIDEPNRKALEKLAKMLSSEIGDPEKMQAYERMIAPIFGAK